MGISPTYAVLSKRVFSPHITEIVDAKLNGSICREDGSAATQTRGWLSAGLAGMAAGRFARPVTLQLT